MQKKLTVAVTGGIGSGKTAFCSFLKEGGFSVYSADLIAKELLASDNEIQKKMIKAFGAQAYVDGNLNKQFIAEKIFSDQRNILKINSIVHPKVIQLLSDKISEALKTKDIVFVEAALVYEADIEDMFDYVVLITAPAEIRQKRKTELENYTESDFVKRNEAQIPDEEKRKRADFTFENRGSLEELQRKSDLLINILKHQEIKN